MTETIWYISKYCTISSKNSTGSRGWLLMEEFTRKGHKSVVITSENDDSYNDFKTSSIIFTKEITKHLQKEIIEESELRKKIFFFSYRSINNSKKFYFLN